MGPSYHISQIIPSSNPKILSLRKFHYLEPNSFNILFSLRDKFSILEFLSTFFQFSHFPNSSFLFFISLFGAIPFKFFVRSLPLFSSNGSLVRRFDFFSKSSFDISAKIQLESSSFQSIQKKYFCHFFC